MFEELERVYNRLAKDDKYDEPLHAASNKLIDQPLAISMKKASIAHDEDNQTGIKYIEPRKFKQQADLDIIVHYALNADENGRTGDGIRGGASFINFENVQLPEYFEFGDPRKPPQQIVYDEMEKILNEVFRHRSGVEKTMTRRELMAYDLVVAKYL